MSISGDLKWRWVIRCMAKISLNKLEGVTEMIDKFGAEADHIVEKMLHRGGMTAKEHLKDGAESKQHVNTGAMRDSMGYTLKKGYGAERYAEVYPQGTVTRTYKGRTKKTKSKKGKKYHVSNALKGFVLNYGSTKRGIERDKWFDNSADTAAPHILSDMYKVFEEEIDKIAND